MYYDMHPLMCAYQQTNGNLQHPYNLNHPEGIPQSIEEKQRKKKNGKPDHLHAYFGSTTCIHGHTHLHLGITGPPIESKKDSHVHKIYGNTSFEEDHSHYYEAYSSPAIPLSNGYHTHYIEISTTENDEHDHVIRGFTAASKS